MVKISLAHPDTTTFTQGVVINGVDFLFRFVWNQRNGCWYVDAALADNTPIVYGAKLVTNVPLFANVPANRRGSLPLMVLIDRYEDSGRAKDPGRIDLSERFSLVTL